MSAIDTSLVAILYRFHLFLRTVFARRAACVLYALYGTVVYGIAHSSVGCRYREECVTLNRAPRLPHSYVELAFVGSLYSGILMVIIVRRFGVGRFDKFAVIL